MIRPWINAATFALLVVRLYTRLGGTGAAIQSRLAEAGALGEGERVRSSGGARAGR